MANFFVWILCIFCLLCIPGCTAGSSCQTGYQDYTYCSYGCCSGYSGYDYCCSYSYDDSSDIVAVIVGSTVGGVVFLAIAITVCVCVCIKMSRSPVTVVSPAAQNPGATVVMAGPGQGGYGNMPQYGNTSQYPAGPSYNSNQSIPPPYVGNQGTAFPGSTMDKVPPPTQ